MFCSRCVKASFETERKARLVALQYSGANAYACPAGNGWHIGHKNKPRTTRKVSFRERRADAFLKAHGES